MDDLFERTIQQLPSVREWIRETLRRHETKAKSASEFASQLGFERLPKYFPPGLLEFAKVVIVEHVPTVPLTSLGLPDLAGFEQMQPTAIAYDDTYFVCEACGEMESLHFHELVHVLQWQHLGFDQFVITYAAGLVLCGYDEHPLEVQARQHERRFNELEPPYDAALQVREELTRIAAGLMPSGL